MGAFSGLVAILIFLFGLFIGLVTEENKYNHHMSICDANNFTYQKCGELYGWDL